MSTKRTLPPQHQDRQPGVQTEMRPQPTSLDREYTPAGKLNGKVAIITGGDSGIGRAVAVHFALEGADVVVAYLDEHEDAEATQRIVEETGRKCLIVPGDLGDEDHCRDVVEQTIDRFGRLDVVVNNAGIQFHHDPKHAIEEVTAEGLEKIFRTNLFAYFFLTKAAMPHLEEGSAIINTTSVTAYKGSAHLLDYSATKGAIVAFTRSLSESVVEKGIRVNAVAPGPVWTPLIPASFPEDEVETFGSSYPMGRPAQPEEIAPSYVFLACDDSSFMSGQVLHPNGGAPVGS